MVKVEVGAMLAAGIWIPLSVPRVAPPFELVMLLNEILNPIEFRTRMPFTEPDTFV